MEVGDTIKVLNYVYDIPAGFLVHKPNNFLFSNFHVISPQEYSIDIEFMDNTHGFDYPTDEKCPNIRVITVPLVLTEKRRVKK